MTTYGEKLRDPRWQRKRLEVLSRDDWQCQRCFSRDKTLNVHHTYYDGEPWDVPLDALYTLCSECHEIEPAEYKEAARCVLGMLAHFGVRTAYDLMMLEDQAMPEAYRRRSAAGLDPIPTVDDLIEALRGFAALRAAYKTSLENHHAVE